MSCPANLQKRAEILSMNGFGPQAPGTGEGQNFVLCWCEELTKEQIETLKNLSGAATVNSSDWIGHGYVSVRWDEYNKINKVLNSMLEMGCAFSTVGKLNMHFEKGETYSPEQEELKAVETHEKFEKDFGYSMLTMKSFWPLYKIWNWKTEEGKAFCHRQRNKVGKKPANYQSKHNHYFWPIFQNYDPETLLDLNKNDTNKRKIDEVKIDEVKIDPEIKEPENKKQKVEEEDELCMICLDIKPDTMVLPCEHCVVCKECSIGLRNTNDKKTCVRCRRPITHILD